MEKEGGQKIKISRLESTRHDENEYDDGNALPIFDNDPYSRYVFPVLKKIVSAKK